MTEDATKLVPVNCWDKPIQYIWTGVAGLGWLIYFWLVLAIPSTGRDLPPVSQIGAIVLGMLLLMAVLALGERPRWPSGARWWLFGAGVAVVGMAYVFNLQLPQMRAVLALALMAVALPIGYWVGDQMQKVTNLIPVAVAFACADIFSVWQGPSKKVVQDLAEHQLEIEAVRTEAMANLPPEAAAAAADKAAAAIRAPFVDYVVVHMPVPGIGTSVPVLGIGDFVIVALLFRVAWLHGISPLAVGVSSLISIIVALAVSQLIGAAIPALPFIAVGVVGYLALAYPQIRRLDRQEVTLSFAVIVLFAALVAARWLGAF
ncbi:hypothetical protein JW859_08430 [bacterium]|nr:hypothetical protein [bacterium]